MKENYEIKRSVTVNYRGFTEAELASTANGTAIIIDDADFGHIALVPIKDKLYRQMWLSESALNNCTIGKVIDLSKASILTITKVVVYSDSNRKPLTIVEEYLDF